jgi:hypothetical protein
MTSDAQPPGTGRTPPATFHVELTPVPAEARPFHALHGAVPAPAVPHLPSHLEEVTQHPMARP